MTGFWRLLIAPPFFAVPIFAKEESRKSFAVSKKNLLLAFFVGRFSVWTLFTWYTAVKSTNVASAAVLASFHPLIVIFITVFIYHKKFRGNPSQRIVVALGGGALIMCADLSAFTQGGQTSGNLFGLRGGSVHGVYFAFGGKVRQEVDGSISVLLIFTSCWICFTLSNLIPGTPLLGYPMTDYLYMICLAFICQIGSHAVWNLCMGHVSSLYVSTWETADPVFATSLAILMVKQIPSTTEVIGPRDRCSRAAAYTTNLNGKRSRHMYKVRLQSFEGPFDLLVYLIETAEMSIYDIKISQITNQYLEYMQAMKERDVLSRRNLWCWRPL